MKNGVKAVSLSKTFNRGRKAAVNNVSFEAFGGEIFGLLGPNGAGKTTTLRMLAMLLSPDKGKIIIDGLTVPNKESDVKKKIGFLTSKLRLDESFNADYLFDFFASLYGLDKSTGNKRKQELFKQFAIENYADIKLSKLSDGMKQKVSLVISILHDPSVVIFDEPTNGLDIIGAKLVTDFLLEQKARGKTIIISTHIFELAEKICDRAGILIDGNLCASGTLESVTNGSGLEHTFFELYQNYSGLQPLPGYSSARIHSDS